MSCQPVWACVKSQPLVTADLYRETSSEGEVGLVAQPPPASP